MTATLSSYAEVQTYITGILSNNIPKGSQQNEEEDAEQKAPHGAFWNTLTYDQFVTGNVPGVNDPDTGQQMPILVKGNAARSNIILALQGAPGTVFDPNTGAIGQMPADGPPFFTPDQIQPIADWIDAGCPE
jgi:hypothetical protein